MLQRDRWPFIPERLSDIIEPETLAVIQAGCVARLRTAMTILEPHPISNPLFQPGRRVDPINLPEKFSPFCALLRNKRHVEGGNDACEACDREVANQAFGNENAPAFELYRCHIGVIDGRHLVYVQDRPVAVLFAGQFQPQQGISEIQENVRVLGKDQWMHIKFYNEETRHELLQKAEQLQPAPADFAAGLQREAEHIGRLAEGQYLATKQQWEQEFCHDLRSTPNIGNVSTLEEIGTLARKLLAKIQKFTRSRYITLFVNTQEGGTVLVPIAHIGIKSKLADSLPHFNWRKAFDKDKVHHTEPRANAQNQAEGATFLTNSTSQKLILQNGIRGDNSELFANATYAAVATLGNTYRSALVFGPFMGRVAIEKEGEFLAEIGRIVGWVVLSELQVIHLQQKHNEWRNRARLLTHQLRTTITPITTHIGAAKLLLPSATNDSKLKMVSQHVDIAQRLCLQLGRAVEPALDSHVLLVERDDLVFQRYSLAVLVSNCADGFDERAQQHQRHIIIDESVERLPTVDMDVARMTIAMSNLIDNALKYSFPGTRIYIRAGRAGGKLDLENAIIEIQDDGDEIPIQHVDKIFQPGTRLLTEAKMQKIPGSGLGLWEVRAVVDAHAGHIQVTTMPSNYTYRQMRAQRVIFRVSLPLSQQNEKE